MTMEHLKRRFKVSLSIFHPSVAPDLISRKFGLAPNGTHKSGDPKQRLDGKPMEGVYRDSFWLYKFPNTDARDLVPWLEEIVFFLESHLEFINELTSSGGTMELFCGIFFDSNWDESLPHDLLGRLSALKIDLRLDAYQEAK